VKQLAPLSNVIPLLARVDTLISDEVMEKKDKIACQLQEAGIKTFSFTPPDFTARSTATAQPYAISSAPGSDHDNMDASLLMSPDYVQPLIPTELTKLVEQVFCQDGVSRLKHSAARKFIQWRNSEHVSRPQALYRPLSLPSGQLPGSSALVLRGESSAFVLAKTNDHIHREERLAQVRLANWAAELQRSLANERLRYEALANNERAAWLTERLNECVKDGSLVPIAERERNDSPSSQRALIRKQGSRSRSSSKTMQHQDPLGLLEVTAKLKARGWLAVEVLGGLGVLGGLAFWLSKHYAYEWAINEWSKFWNGER